MKKMMKNYEAPVAEMFEMQMPTVLMSSVGSTHGNADSGTDTTIPVS
jgi:hypothetical protein